MEPRLKSAKARPSTSLPQEYVSNIRELFEQNFKQQLNGRKVLVEGRLYKDELLLSVGFLPEPGSIRQINFEASMDHSGKNIERKLSVCVDALASMMSQYFENEDSQEDTEEPQEIDFPLNWTEYDFEKEKIWLQVSRRNTDLENEANRLLGLDSNDSLYSEGEDAEELKELEALEQESSKEDQKFWEQIKEKLENKRGSDN